MGTYKFAVVGAGYVGLPYSVLLAQHESVTVVDTDERKVSKINERISPIRDSGIEEYLHEKALDLRAIMADEIDYSEMDYVLIAAPTDYEPEAGKFDTSIVDQIVFKVTQQNPNAYIIIKSTVPIGYTDSIRALTGNPRVMFSPEFLRETRALYDTLHPSRIILGVDKENTQMLAAAESYIKCLQEGMLEKDVTVLFMNSREAEAVKLFANTYLAMRVAYFNELDTFAEEKGLDTRSIIEGVCSDSRIGSVYNNPSFGYGGYCLPKDTRQLLADFGAIPERMIRATVESNEARQDYMVRKILEKAEQNKGSEKPVIGIFRLTMKSGSDNFRQAAVLPIMSALLEKNVRVLVYEPALPMDKAFPEAELVNDLERFKAEAQVIVANRYDDCLNDVKDHVFSRDLFFRD